MNNNRVVDQIFNIFWILFGIGICIQSIRHQLWSPAGPGSGFIPFLTGLLIGASGFLLFLSERSNVSKKEGNRKVLGKSNRREEGLLPCRKPLYYGPHHAQIRIPSYLHFSHNLNDSGD